MRAAALMGSPIAPFLAGVGEVGHMLEETQEGKEIIERIAALDIGTASLACCARCQR